MNHLEEHHLLDLALGVVPAAARGGSEAHLKACPACRASFAQLVQTTAKLDLQVKKVAPPASVGLALFAKLQGAERFSDLFDQVGQLFDLSLAGVRKLLEAVDDPSKWEPGPSDGVEILPVEAGPSRSNALVAIAKLPEGTRMPAHDHFGREVMFVLQGGFREETGHEVWRGEELVMLPGTSHELTGLSGPVCLAASVLEMG